MYKVIKGKGAYQNISVMNTDTMSSIIIGKVTMSILTILEKDGKTPLLDVNKEWDIDISFKAATDLANLAMGIHAPDRKNTNKRNPSEQNTSEEKHNKQPVDVFNLIFGTE